MKFFKHNLASSNHHGLSVIEVLTSIVVALIGVFGVLAMIPFSVKQTQSGLDRDVATSLARSALSNFEAYGFKVVSGTNRQLNWVLDNGGTRVRAKPRRVAADGDPVSTGQLVCIDPLGIAEDGFNTFPFNCSITGVSELSMPAVNVIRPNGTPFDRADARRMFRLTDDLVFEQTEREPTAANPDPDLTGPQQIFNEAAGGGLLNRQSNGTASWCAIAQPIVHNRTAEEVDSYKFNVLVFKDRITDADPSVEESKMAAAVVTSPTGSADPLSSVTIGTTLNDNVRRNDWVMLINQAAGPTTTPVSLRTNMAFARISNLYNDETNNSARLTLDGPNFNFTGTTYIVHLRNVVAVFPRTIKLETVSTWNVSD